MEFNNGRPSAGPAPVDERSQSNNRYKIAIVAPTCFYYQAPIFRELAGHPNIDLMVYFCSREALNGKDVRKLFQSQGGWGTGQGLLEGYNYKFLSNISPTQSYLSWPTGLINPGILKELAFRRPDAVVVMGWNNPTWWMTILGCLTLKIPLFYMNDANVQAELYQKRWKALIKKMMLGGVFFRLTAGFLSSGRANDRFYRFYGVKKEKLIPFAYSLVHNIMLPQAQKLREQRLALRAKLCIPEDSFVILFCGRLIREKGVLELVDAYKSIDEPKKTLIFVGDGEFSEDLKAHVSNNQVEFVRYHGFQKRDEVAQFYALSDVLVLPSRRETWGMVVNEALCFGLPVIVSDQVGARDDLVFNDYNGYDFPVRNVKALASRIKAVMDLSESERQTMGDNSVKIIQDWSGKTLAEPFLQYLDSLPKYKSRSSDPGQNPGPGTAAGK